MVDCEDVHALSRRLSQIAPTLSPILATLVPSIHPFNLFNDVRLGGLPCFWKLSPCLALHATAGLDLPTGYLSTRKRRLGCSRDVPAESGLCGSAAAPYSLEWVLAGLVLPHALKLPLGGTIPDKLSPWTRDQ